MKKLLQCIGLVFLTITLSFTLVDKKTVVIDVSHGGQDSGVHIDGISEKEIALEIANTVKALNQNANVEIVLSRDADVFLSLKDRIAFINELNPALVISVHTNSSNSHKASGTEIFISNEGEESKKSKALALKLENAFKHHDAEIKTAEFQLLKNVKAPIAMVEVGFLSNSNDKEWLTSKEGQTQIAESILKAIQ